MSASFSTATRLLRSCPSTSRTLVLTAQRGPSPLLRRNVARFYSASADATSDPSRDSATSQSKGEGASKEESDTKALEVKDEQIADLTVSDDATVPELSPERPDLMQLLRLSESSAVCSSGFHQPPKNICPRERADHLLRDLELCTRPHLHRGRPRIGPEVSPSFGSDCVELRSIATAGAPEATPRWRLHDTTTASPNLGEVRSDAFRSNRRAIRS